MRIFCVMVASWLGACAHVTAPMATTIAGGPTTDTPKTSESATPFPAESSGIWGLWDSYSSYFDRKLEEVLDKPVWGGTAQLPQGVFKAKWGYTNASAKTYFDNDGKEVPLLPAIELTDFPEPGDTLAIDPRITGGGGEHMFHLSYGITDPLDVFIEMPFTNASTQLDLQGFINGEEISGFAKAGVESHIRTNGRPLPGESFEGSMDPGDLRAGVSWNFHRTEYFSAALTPRIFFPTGKRAEPNNDIMFLLGPELDRGDGAWAINLTSGFDVRLVKWPIKLSVADFDFQMVLNFEVQATYRFGHDRRAPKWLPITDCKRIENPDRRAEINCPVNVEYDPIYNLEQSMFFPDLTGLGKKFWVEPGLATGFMASVIFDILFVTVQAVWQFDRVEAPTIVARGDPDAAAAFEMLTKTLGLYAASEIHTLGVGIQIPLLPLYIPVIVTPSARWIVAGRNTVKLEDQYGVSLELLLPVTDFF